MVHACAAPTRLVPWIMCLPLHFCTSNHHAQGPPCAFTFHAGMRVTAVPGRQVGRIEGGFGKSGKFKVYFPGGAPPLHKPGQQQQQQQGEQQAGGVAPPAPPQPPPRVVLCFKRFMFDNDRRHMAQ